MAVPTQLRMLSMLMMFRAKFTLWHGGHNEPESDQYVYSQACESLEEFSKLLENHVNNKYQGIIRSVVINNEGTV